MALTLERPWLLLLWPLLAALLVAVALVRRPQNLLGLGLRLGMMTLLVVGLANPIPFKPVAAPSRQVILVDRSAGVHPEALSGVQRVVETETALDGIGQAVERIHQMAEQMAAAATQQNLVAEDISRQIANISQASEHNAQITSRSAQLGRELESTAHALHALVARFER